MLFKDWMSKDLITVKATELYMIDHGENIREFYCATEDESSASGRV